MTYDRIKFRNSIYELVNFSKLLDSSNKKARAGRLSQNIDYVDILIKFRDNIDFINYQSSFEETKDFSKYVFKIQNWSEISNGIASIIKNNKYNSVRSHGAIWVTMYKVLKYSKKNE